MNTRNTDRRKYGDDGTNNLIMPQKDALVIKLCVLDTNIKRVLIDSGSSVNII